MRKIYWILFWGGIIFFSGCDAQEQFFQTAKESNPKLVSGSTLYSYCDSPDVVSYQTRDLSRVAVFNLPGNSISLQVSAFNGTGVPVRMSSLINPRRTDLLGTAPLGSIRFQRAGYAGISVPMVPGHSALSGQWGFQAVNATQIQLTFRTGATPTKSTVTVQVYLSGSKYSSSKIEPALQVLKTIYENAGVNICLRAPKTIAGSEFSIVSSTFGDATTGRLISQGRAGVGNIFFVEDLTGRSAGSAGISPGIPGSQGISGNYNGVLVGLDSHVSGGTLNTQFLGETAAHELGHWFGLFHTTESFGPGFDILADTPECPASQVRDCLDFDGRNNMFWQGDVTVKQTTLTADQIYIINYSPIAY